jgi:hypothetical protein
VVSFKPIMIWLKVCGINICVVSHDLLLNFLKFYVSKIVWFTHYFILLSTRGRKRLPYVYNLVYQVPLL